MTMVSHSSVARGCARCLTLVGSVVQQVAFLSMMGQWVPALMWIMLQKLQEAALWVWQHMHPSWPTAQPQPQYAGHSLEPAQGLYPDTAAAASSSTDRKDHHASRISSRRNLSELDQLLRVCETIANESAAITGPSGQHS